MFRINLKMKSKETDVITFIDQFKEVLTAEDFDIDTNFILIRKMKEEEEYSTPYTLLDLEYSTEDVVACLMELSIDEYSETMIDKNDLNPPLLFVFGKRINGKLIYIKLKIKGEQRRQVLCVSFHYAEYEMKFPYA